MRNPLTILITGASSGIGEALALAYARPGRFLALLGRDAARLSDVAQRCQRQGAAIETAMISVTDASRMADWITALDGRAPLDLVVANAGISGGTARGHETADQVRAIFATNVEGVINTVTPVIGAMTARGRGQIAIMSSLASFRGFPSAPAYCASKAAVRVWGEALRAELAPHGVGVSVICPGFVVSRITAANEFRMPLLMSADRAARIIVRGLARNRARTAFPWPIYAAARLVATLPPALIDPLLRRAPRKA